MQSHRRTTKKLIAATCEYIKLFALRNKANAKIIAVNKYEFIHFATRNPKFVIIEPELYDHIIIIFSVFLFSFTAKRPPVEETASFLQSLIASHGPNYLEKLFGSKARDALSPLGGVDKVAIALSESQTIDDFGAALHLMK